MQSRFNIIFDLDGTLTDPKEGITTCIKYALERLGESIPDDLDWCIGPPLAESYQKLLKDNSAKTIDQAITYYRERFTQVGMFENKLYPDIIPMLDYLVESRYPLYIATSKPTIYAKKIIEHFNLSHYFQEIYGSELDDTRSHKIELISYLLQKELLNSSNAYMIGDRKHDLIGAKENKIRALGVLYGYGSYEELKKCDPEQLFSSPIEIKNYFFQAADYPVRSIHLL